jgi:hypothetical protein
MARFLGKFRAISGAENVRPGRNGGPCSPLRTVLRVPCACLQGRTGNFRHFRPWRSAFRCYNPLNSCLFPPEFPVTNNREFNCRNRVLESASRESGLACREPRYEEQRTPRELASVRGSRGASGHCLGQRHARLARSNTGFRGHCNCALDRPGPGAPCMGTTDAAHRSGQPPDMVEQTPGASQCGTGRT